MNLTYHAALATKQKHGRSAEEKGKGLNNREGITSAETIFINHFLFGNNWRVVYLREGESFLFNQLKLTQKYH